MAFLAASFSSYFLSMLFGPDFWSSEWNREPLTLYTDDLTLSMVDSRSIQDERLYSLYAVLVKLDGTSEVYHLPRQTVKTPSTGRQCFDAAV